MRTIIFLLLVVVAALSGCSTIGTTRLWMPETFGMEPISAAIYVDPAMARADRMQIIDAADNARQRIRLYYGSVLSNPQIIACASEQCFQDAGGVTARAKTFGASRILLSPRGLTAPMIAHEWSHAELAIRVDRTFAMGDIPHWFTEGLAVLVSNEPTHSEAAWQAIQESGQETPRLTDLDTREKWLAATKKYGDTSANVEEYRIVYTTAGHEVRRWYRKAGRTGLTYLIESIRQSKPFNQAYREAEGIGLN